jgi:hypothetical protein
LRISTWRSSTRAALAARSSLPHTRHHHDPDRAPTRHREYLFPFALFSGSLMFSGWMCRKNRAPLYLLFCMNCARTGPCRRSIGRTSSHRASRQSWTRTVWRRTRRSTRASSQRQRQQVPHQRSHERRALLTTTPGGAGGGGPSNAGLTVFAPTTVAAVAAATVAMAGTPPTWPQQRLHHRQRRRWRGDNDNGTAKTGKPRRRRWQGDDREGDIDNNNNNGTSTTMAVRRQRLWRRCCGHDIRTV